ncbi:phage tail assembly protein [Bosea sp. 2KB_26]|uniref:phage tail assembly protein n=1 Tax=Bosea sp. 2KB_26 TaxID=3237475 RepID=UPI003F917C4F
MATPHDPDFDPIRPPPGSPDQLGVPREPPHFWIDPAANTAADLANGRLTVSFGPAPHVAPADPSAWSNTVPLDHEMIVDGKKVAAITIRRPTGNDVAELLMEDDNEATLPLRLRARICGHHPAVFGALWADDAERVAAACRPFLPRAILAIEAEMETDAAG